MSVAYPPGSLVSALLTGNRETVLGPDQTGFDRFLGACVDSKPRNGRACTWYIQDNIETRMIYDWDHLINFYFAFIKEDTFYMADAWWHHVLSRNGIRAHRILPFIELENLLPAAVCDLKLDHITKTFTTLANNPNDSRYRVHQHLVQRGFLDRCHWSWRNGRGYSCFFNNNRWLGIREGAYCQFDEQVQPGTLWEPDMGTEALHHHVISAITLCGQTLFHSSGPVYDGKVFKCFLTQRPFVLIGSSGTLADLRDQGFQTFAAFVDESYDLEQDPHRRMDLILAEIDRLAAMPLRQLVQIIYDHRDIFAHNFQRCMQLQDALQQKDLAALLMPPCQYLTDYDNLLSVNQMRC